MATSLCNYHHRVVTCEAARASTQQGRTKAGAVLAAWADAATPEAKKGWSQIAEAAARSDTWRLVEAHDLNEPSTEHSLIATDVPQLVAVVRAGSVLAAQRPSLTDSFLQQIRSG